MAYKLRCKFPIKSYDLWHSPFYSPLILIVAQLDRLARSVSFLFNLLESDVDESMERK
ncbi:hypothetical protein [Phocaeicola sartorii]|uniref:hypothetical protein n=1 Tax=Phocaeicola sartorii TaxID=671267 RepID=UPI0035183591